MQQKATDYKIVSGDGTRIAVSDLGGSGPPVVLLHGLAGSSRELIPSAAALVEDYRVVLIDQRGHGASTRRPGDVSRQAFVNDVVSVIERVSPQRSVTVIGQSMGAHTAMLTAAARPDLVDRLVMLEGHADGAHEPGDAEELAEFFDSWPTPFEDHASARAALGDSPLARAWIADLELTPEGLRPRFDADVMASTLTAVHEPRWDEWKRISSPTLAIFAEHGIFSEQQKEKLIAVRPHAERADLHGASHDAHLDAFDAWIEVLRDFLASSFGER